MTTRMRVLIAAALSVCTGGCSLAMGIRQNTDAIGGSTSAIARQYARRSRNRPPAPASLVPALQGVERLRGPMESVAALDPTLEGRRRTCASRWARWRRSTRSMRALAALRTPMTQLVAIRPGLEATAALGPSMDRLARDASRASKPSPGCTARSSASPAWISSWRRWRRCASRWISSASSAKPMERLAALEGPMTSVAELGNLISRPWLIAIVGLPRCSRGAP